MVNNNNNYIYFLNYTTHSRCSCEPLIGKVEKILTWRWKGMEEKEEEEKKNAAEGGTYLILEPVNL